MRREESRTNLGEHSISIVVIADQNGDFGAVSLTLVHELAELAMHGIHGER